MELKWWHFYGHYSLPDDDMMTWRPCKIFAILTAAPYLSPILLFWVIVAEIVRISLLNRIQASLNAGLFDVSEHLASSSAAAGGNKRTFRFLSVCRTRCCQLKGESSWKENIEQIILLATRMYHCLLLLFFFAVTLIAFYPCPAVHLCDRLHANLVIDYLPTNCS